MEENSLMNTGSEKGKVFPIIQRMGNSGMLYFEGYSIKSDTVLWTGDISRAYAFPNKEMAEDGRKIYKTKGEIVEHQF